MSKVETSKIKNVLGQEIKICGCDPMTGWYRDGYCHTDFDDKGIHTVCCVVDQNFLEFLKKDGNDLITPKPEFQFYGLKPSDHWCVCAGSWLRAYQNNSACLVDLEATHEETLAIIPLKFLLEYDLNKESKCN